MGFIGFCQFLEVGHLWEEVYGASTVQAEGFLAFFWLDLRTLTFQVSI